MENYRGDQLQVHNSILQSPSSECGSQGFSSVPWSWNDAHQGLHKDGPGHDKWEQIQELWHNSPAQARNGRIKEFKHAHDKMNLWKITDTATKLGNISTTVGKTL